MRRLTKAHAVQVVDAIDTPALRHEVLSALAWLLGHDWPAEASADRQRALDLVREAAEVGGWPQQTTVGVLNGDIDVLTDLAISLSELRTVERPG